MERQTKMTKYIITCPECSAAMITTTPSATIWELCPYCRHHVMDGYDVMMAQAIADGPSSQNDVAALMNKVISN
jgi:Zn-finger nucleic acid-binding protein